MFTAYVIAAVVFGLAATGTAIAKIRRVPRVVAELTAVGVPPSWPVPLGLLNLAGAVLAHVRVRDAKGLPMPTALLTGAAVTLALAVASA